MEHFWKYFFFKLHFLKLDWPGVVKRKQAIFMLINPFSAYPCCNALLHAPSKDLILFPSVHMVCALLTDNCQGLPACQLHPLWTSQPGVNQPHPTAGSPAIVLEVSMRIASASLCLMLGALLPMAIYDHARFTTTDHC